jgi:hypothetical protein
MRDADTSIVQLSSHKPAQHSQHTAPPPKSLTELPARASPLPLQFQRDAMHTINSSALLQIKSVAGLSKG